MIDSSGVSERTHGQIDIAAPREAIIAVIADLSSYPQWSGGITGAEVLNSVDGRPQRARLQFAAGPMTDEFVLEYEWHDNSSVDWHIVDPGEMIKRQNGTYTLTDLGNGTVRVAYDLEVELSIPIIGKLRTRAEKQIIKAALSGLKRQVEQGSAIQD